MTKEQKIEQLLTLWERIAKMTGDSITTEDRSKAYTVCEALVDAFDILNTKSEA